MRSCPIPTQRTPRTLRLALTLALALTTLLGACAPSASPPVPRVSGSLTPDAPSFYPHETGLTWTYLAEGETIITPAYTLSVLGPSVLEGDRVILTRMRGRTLDTTYYKQHTSDGVFLHREDRPGATITYDPPLHELPTPNALRPGTTWSGTTTATITYDKTQAPTINTLDYTYTVLEQREANVPAGTFPAYTIEFAAEQQDGERTESIRQHEWFTPYWGTVKTRGELLLTGGNILTVERP